MPAEYFKFGRDVTIIPDSLSMYPSELKVWHGTEYSPLRWRITADGLEIEGEGIQRTAGEPVTMRRIYEEYGNIIRLVESSKGVPAELIMTTIATESGGNKGAIRQEPGYISDTETPHRVSVGLMQTLISTAQSMQALCGYFGVPPMDRTALIEPYWSILSGALYIKFQSKQTHFDPPLVAAAYNAGGIYRQQGKKNRWGLRQYPIGTGKHCDRFVQWWGDALAVTKEATV